MKITILGSAAAEAVPNPFCQCSVCQKARVDGGPDCRARSAVIVNDDLLIDFGPDIISSANKWRIYLGNIETLLLTHRHEDHWLPQNFVWRRSVFAPTLTQNMFLFAPDDALSNLPDELGELCKLRWQAIKAGDQWIAGQYRITAIPATHGEGKIQAVLYVIDDGKHKVFYATDTAPFSDTAWQILDSLGSMDLIFLDATMGPGDGGQAHHGISQFLQTREMMIEHGLLMPSSTMLAAHHFSHNGGLTHKELRHIFSQSGVDVAYDGWVINLKS